ncbi:MAG: hypothetical protein ABI353_16120 [Isosphaeraceae bacterium]
MIDRKIEDIQSHFVTIVGERITRYETAELLQTDSTWVSWADLPIRLYTGSGRLVAISWSKFDDLWLADDTSLPFPIGDSTVKWVINGLEAINPAVGASIRSVMLGQGEMSIEGKALEIWTRLVIELDEGWLEVFNALDENGYVFHVERPVGVFIPCLPAP